MQPYDRSSKWLIEHYGVSILRLAGITDVVSWKALQAEVVQPRQLPDGLLEVQIAGTAEPTYFLIEIATFPDRRVAEQVLRGTCLVYLDRRVVPEAITLVLQPKGNAEVTGRESFRSQLNCTELQIGWRVVELWKMSGKTLLEANEVGVIPWVVLSRLEEPVLDVFQECRRRIDQQAKADERANLLAVSQVLMRLRYNDPEVLAIFGGSQAMIESPLIQELVAKTRQNDIIDVLESRFGRVSAELIARLRAVQDEDVLRAHNRFAAQCSSLDSFRDRLN